MIVTAFVANENKHLTTVNISATPSAVIIVGTVNNVACQTTEKLDITLDGHSIVCGEVLPLISKAAFSVNHPNMDR